MKQISLLFIGGMILLSMSSCMHILGFRSVRHYSDSELLSFQKRTDMGKDLYRVDSEQFWNTYHHLSGDTSAEKFNNLLQPMQVIVYDHNKVLKTHLINCNIGGLPLKWNRVGSFDTYPIMANGLRQPEIIVDATIMRRYITPYISDSVWNSWWSQHDHVYFVLYSLMAKPHARRMINFVQRHESRYNNQKLKIVYVNADDLLVYLEKKGKMDMR